MNNNLIMPLGYVLLAVASPAFLASAFEMYAVTPDAGPQRMFFSMASFPELRAAAQEGAILAIVLGISAIGFVLSLLFSTALCAAWLRGSFEEHGHHIQIFGLIAIGQAVHLALFFSYGWWAPALFSGRVS